MLQPQTFGVIWVCTGKCCISGELLTLSELQVIANKDAIEGVSFTSNIPCELAESIAKSVHVNLQALLSFV